MLENIDTSVGIIDALKNRIQWTHESVITSTIDLSQNGFARQPGPFAPSIGWHVWHVARFADRLQANLNGKAEIWQANDYVTRWVLESENLGILENGLNMPLGLTGEVVEHAGKDEILQYANDIFAAVTAGFANLKPADFETMRPSVFAYEWQAGKVDENPARHALLSEDLVRYLGHASRHLGMIEALLGVVFEIEGTASI
ncbi:MAG: DinB family protein [Ardenticatenaceae bacterium]|nr:DinB family protein [Ardenticatenaceae bacterium]